MKFKIYKKNETNKKDVIRFSKNHKTHTSKDETINVCLELQKPHNPQVRYLHTINSTHTKQQEINIF